MPLPALSETGHVPRFTCTVRGSTSGQLCEALLVQQRHRLLCTIDPILESLHTSGAHLVRAGSRQMGHDEFLVRLVAKVLENVT